MKTVDRAETKELSSLSPSPSLLVWLQMWYLWPELSPSEPEVLSRILLAVSPWSWLMAAVPTYVFSLHQLHVFQYVVNKVRKDL